MSTILSIIAVIVVVMMNVVDIKKEDSEDIVIDYRTMTR